MRAVLFNDTNGDRHHGCTTVIETIHQLCAASGIDILAAAPAHFDWRSNSRIVAAVAEADILIVNGEGTLHHDRPAGIPLLAVAEAGRKRRIPSALINATWQANGDEFTTAARLFDFVAVRESASQAELTRSGIPSHRIPDLALYHHPELTTERTGFGYCDSVLGPVALELYQRMWRLGGEPVPITRPRRNPISALRSLSRFAGRPIELLNPAIGFPAMRATLQDLAKQHRKLNELTSAVAAKRAIVTGRFHMLIFCLASVTPMLVVASNTAKNEATLTDAGLEPWRLVASVSDIDSALIERASHWHGDEESRVRHFVASARASQEDLFCHLAQLARKHPSYHRIASRS